MFGIETLTYATLKEVASVGKAVYDFLKYKEEVKQIDREWLAKSGLERKAAEDGYTLAWARHDRVETLKLDGYDVMYQYDKLKRIRYRIELKDLVLMGTK